MFKTSILVAKINKALSIKFNIIIQNDNISNGSNKLFKTNSNRADNLYEINGSKYYNINPTSFITLDFQEHEKHSNDDNHYNKLRSLNLNKMQTFLFCRDLKIMMNKFYKYSKTNTPIFWYDKNELMMNRDLSQKIKISRNFFDKSIQMEFIINTIDTPTGQYKIAGCVLYSVSIADSCFLNIDEVEYLIHIIDNIDFTNITLNLLNLGLNKLKELNYDQSSINKIHHIIKENNEENPNETKHFVIPKQPENCGIPNI